MRKFFFLISLIFLFHQKHAFNFRKRLHKNLRLYPRTLCMLNVKRSVIIYVINIKCTRKRILYQFIWKFNVFSSFHVPRSFFSEKLSWKNYFEKGFYGMNFLLEHQLRNVDAWKMQIMFTHTLVHMHLDRFLFTTCYQMFSQ